MLSKAILHSRAVARGLFRCHKAKAHSGYVKKYAEPHFNDVPLPIPYEEYYNKRQVGNNTVLLAGISFFALSFGFVLNSGVMVFNLTPPKKNLSSPTVN